MAATKNVLEMSKVNTIGQNPFFSTSSGLNNTLFMNMSINPLGLPAISGLNFPGNSMFFPSNGSSKGNESPYSSSQPTMDQSLNLSQSSLDDQDCDDEIDSSLMAENASRVLAHRNQKRPIPNEQKDGKYFERRRRNNLAAKKSRDARKTREDQLAMRVAHLEKENAIFRAQVAILREEMSVLQLYLCQKASGNFKNETNG